MRRPTIADIARRAGVTKAAVSFALNGQPGVSAATRERILAIAAEIGFEPSSAARALSGGRAGAFGLIIDRPARTLGVEVFFMQLISGIQAELAPNHITLQFTLAEDQAEEIGLYRTWWAQRRVDGVFLVDLQVRDRRIRALTELGMPAVVLGTPRGSGRLPAVWQDDRAATETVVGYLAGLGHRRIARVGGFARYWHSKLRTDALAQVAGAAGIEAVSVAADYTAEHGAEATRDLLKGDAPPTAIVYDNDVMAVAGARRGAAAGRPGACRRIRHGLGRQHDLRTGPPRVDRAAPGHPGGGCLRRADAPRDGRGRAARQRPGDAARPRGPGQHRRRPGDPPEPDLESAATCPFLTEAGRLAWHFPRASLNRYSQ